MNKETVSDIQKDITSKVPGVRVGTGFDVHAFAEDRKLILGGVEIPYDKGLKGHSDADVLTHALMDAMLGACALGDIGKLFPDTDPKYEGADSIELLGEVTNRLKEEGFVLGNADITVICQAPRIGKFTDEMRMNIAKAAGVCVDAISIKGTTTEGLGFPGRGEGIACQAICTVMPL